MKKIIFALLFLIPANVFATFACYNYTSDVKAVYEFENNGLLVDCIGNSNLAAYGNGGSQISTPVIYDTYAYHTDSGNNGAKVTYAIQDLLGASHTWTMQYCFYSTATSTFRNEISKYNTTFDLLVWAIYGSGTPVFSVWYAGANLGTTSFTPVSGKNVVDLCFNDAGSGYFKVWINGTLKLTQVTTTNVFATHSNFFIGSENGSGYGVCGFEAMDRLIFSTQDSAGAEIVPVMPSPTATPTSTNTHTLTATMTQTLTSTMTKTNTWTMTTTLTHTMTWTITPTRTWTLSSTLTPTKTITSTYTATPDATRTPMTYPAGCNRPVIGYRITQNSGRFFIVWKWQTIQFIEWQALYYLKPAGMTIQELK